MDLSDLIVAIFCYVDDALLSLETPVRRSGPVPQLSDAEVITIEVVGEYLELGQDKALFAYFRRHWSHFFPALSHVSRTTFVRQGANLWRVKERVWRIVLDQVSYDPAFALVDSFPLPVCRFGRARRCKLFRPEAAFGWDSVAEHAFFGFRLHFRVCWPGVVTEVGLAPANAPETDCAGELAVGTTGWLIGDRNYSAPLLKEDLARQNIRLVAPFKFRSRDRYPEFSHTVTLVRCRIETLFDQFVERFQVRQSKARDLWHLASRLIRKILSHTLMILLNQRGNHWPSTQIARLLA